MSDEMCNQCGKPLCERCSHGSSDGCHAFTCSGPRPTAKPKTVKPENGLTLWLVLRCKNCEDTPEIKEATAERIAQEEYPCKMYDAADVDALLAAKDAEITRLRMDNAVLRRERDALQPLAEIGRLAVEYYEEWNANGEWFAAKLQMRNAAAAYLAAQRDTEGKS